MNTIDKTADDNRRQKICALIALLLTTVLCWSFVSSTATIRWTGGSETADAPRAAEAAGPHDGTQRA